MEVFKSIKGDDKPKDDSKQNGSCTQNHPPHSTKGTWGRKHQVHVSYNNILSIVEVGSFGGRTRLVMCTFGVCYSGVNYTRDVCDFVLDFDGNYTSLQILSHKIQSSKLCRTHTVCRDCWKENWWQLSRLLHWDLSSAGHTSRCNQGAAAKVSKAACGSMQFCSRQSFPLGSISFAAAWYGWLSGSWF